MSRDSFHFTIVLMTLTSCLYFLWFILVKCINSIQTKWSNTDDENDNRNNDNKRRQEERSDKTRTQSVFDELHPPLILSQQGKDSLPTMAITRKELSTQQCILSSSRLLQQMMKRLSWPCVSNRLLFTCVSSHSSCWSKSKLLFDCFPGSHFFQSLLPVCFTLLRKRSSLVCYFERERARKRRQSLFLFFAWISYPFFPFLVSVVNRWRKSTLWTSSSSLTHVCLPHIQFSPFSYFFLNLLLMPFFSIEVWMHVMHQAIHHTETENTLQKNKIEEKTGLKWTRDWIQGIFKFPLQDCSTRLLYKTREKIKGKKWAKWTLTWIGHQSILYYCQANRKKFWEANKEKDHLLFSIFCNTRDSSTEKIHEKREFEYNEILYRTFLRLLRLTQICLSGICPSLKLCMYVSNFLHVCLIRVSTKLEKHSLCRDTRSCCEKNESLVLIWESEEGRKQMSNVCIKRVIVSTSSFKAVPL